MNLSALPHPVPPRATSRGGAAAPSPHRPSGGPSPAPAPTAGGYDPVEDEVARTADLVLKVHRLLERAEGLDREPDRSVRIERLTWAVRHGQDALRRAANGPSAVPAPRRHA